MPRTITATVYRDGLVQQVTGTTTRTTVHGAVRFTDLRIYRPKVGAYSVAFTTPDIDMAPASAARLLRARAWQTSVSVTVTEGAAHSLELQQALAPTVLDNVEVRGWALGTAGHVVMRSGECAPGGVVECSTRSTGRPATSGGGPCALTVPSQWACGTVRVRVPVCVFACARACSCCACAHAAGLHVCTPVYCPSLIS